MASKYAWRNKNFDYSRSKIMDTRCVTLSKVKIKKITGIASCIYPVVNRVVYLLTMTTAVVIYLYIFVYFTISICCVYQTSISKCSSVRPINFFDLKLLLLLLSSRLVSDSNHIYIYIIYV